MNHRISVSIFLGVLLAAGAAGAHHSEPSFAAKNVRLTGTLTKVDWRNPHVRFSLEVKGDQGQAESWIIGSSAPNVFARHKISKADFEKAIGQTVIVDVLGEVATRGDGSRRGGFQKITFPDGKVVSRGW